MKSCGGSVQRLTGSAIQQQLPSVVLSVTV